MPMRENERESLKCGLESRGMARQRGHLTRGLFNKSVIDMSYSTHACYIVIFNFNVVYAFMVQMRVIFFR